jgi:hypothetical protein
MIEAFIHGKLSAQQENMEDMLTSCIFGSLRLLPPMQGLVPYLQLAEPFECDGVQFRSRLSTIVGREDVDYRFWTWLKSPHTIGCEPDLLITIKPCKLLILVESKLFSGKSTVADEGASPMDQLAREWDNLTEVAMAAQLDPVLVYITTDLLMPRTDLQEAFNEFRSKRASAAKPQFFWLSWGHLFSVPHDSLGVINRCLLILRRLDLEPFVSWKNVLRLPRYSPSYESVSFRWNDLKPTVLPKWSFEISA